MRTFIIAGFILGVVATNAAPAGTLYVDGVHGNDHYNGQSGRVENQVTGPVRTIGKALEIAKRGDVIEVAPTEEPYYEAVAVTGLKNSGFGVQDLVINGNGAIVSGARKVPPIGWVSRGDGLWEIVPIRKGHYLLLKDGGPVPEFKPEGDWSLDRLPAGEWAARSGSIFYRHDGAVDPRELDFAIAGRSVGLTFYNVRYVTVRDLTFEHFRLDGVNAHDLANNIRLVNVRTRENGRAGFAVGGSSDIVLEKCASEANRRNSVLVTGKGVADLREATIDQPVTVED